MTASQQRLLELSNLNEGHLMNWLQSLGLVSDNAIALSDVADADCERVLRMLQPDCLFV